VTRKKEGEKLLKRPLRESSIEPEGQERGGGFIRVIRVQPGQKEDGGEEPRDRSDVEKTSPERRVARPNRGAASCAGGSGGFWRKGQGEGAEVGKLNRSKRSRERGIDRTS